MLGVALSGCATVVQGTTENLHVATVPDTQADCVLRNREGQWRTTTPGTVKVKRSKSALHVECDAPGYGRGTATAEAHFNDVTFGNVVAGGLIGVGVDAATGANESYDDVTIPLGPPLAENAPPEAPEGPTPVAEDPLARRVARHEAPDTAWQPVPQGYAAPLPDAPAPEAVDDDTPPPWGDAPESPPAPALDERPSGHR